LCWRRFHAWKKKVEGISVLTEAEWQKKREAESGSGATAGTRALTREVREID
jgi:hypothetical protein